MRNYHLVLRDGQERNLKAADFEVTTSGALYFSNADGETVAVYAAGGWTMVEVERLDDKG
jgi:hypothetical protein